MDWRSRAVCRTEDPELFFPVGTSGPALVQTEQAKAVCRRCLVTEECLAWALETGQDAGVWGGMSEDERRVVRRKEESVPSLLRKLKVMRRRRRLAVWNQHHTKWDLPNGRDELRSIIDSGEIALVRPEVVRDAH